MEKNLARMDATFWGTHANSHERLVHSPKAVETLDNRKKKCMYSRLMSFLRVMLVCNFSFVYLFNLACNCSKWVVNFRYILTSKFSIINQLMQVWFEVWLLSLGLRLFLPFFLLLRVRKLQIRNPFLENNLS